MDTLYLTSPRCESLELTSPRCESPNGPFVSGLAIMIRTPGSIYVGKKSLISGQTGRYCTINLDLAFMPCAYFPD